MKLILNSTLIAVSALVAIGCGRNSSGGDQRYNDPYYNQGGVGGGVVTGGVRGGGYGGPGGYGGGAQGPGGYPQGGQGALCQIQNIDDYFDNCGIGAQERRVTIKQGFYRSAGTSNGVYPEIFSDQKFLTHYKVSRQEVTCLRQRMCGDQGGFQPGQQPGPRGGYPQRGPQAGYPEQGPQQGPGQGGYQPFEPDQADLPNADGSNEGGYEGGNEQEQQQERASRPRRGR